MENIIYSTEKRCNVLIIWPELRLSPRSLKYQCIIPIETKQNPWKQKQKKVLYYFIQISYVKHQHLFCCLPFFTCFFLSPWTDKANEDEVEDFKMEINFMKTIGHHENVVTMLGCCTLYPPLCLVVECVPHGDLLHYLRDLRKTVTRTWISHFLETKSTATRKEYVLF